jgi:hypothetical protein
MNTISSESLGRRLCCAAAAALLAAGCGSAAHRTSQTQQTSTASQTTSARTTTGTQPAARSKPKTETAAGATAHGNGGAVPTGGAAPSSASLRPRRFVYLANTVCQAQGGGVPTHFVPAKPARLRDYARVALPPTQRIVLVLQRLSAQGAHSAGVSRLIVEYQGLLALYQHAAYAKASAVNARSIAAAQQRTSASARALHLPLCAPVRSAG